MWKNIGDKLHHTIIALNIPIEDLPWVDGRLDTVTLMNTWKRGRDIEQMVDNISTQCLDCGLKGKNCKCDGTEYDSWLDGMIDENV